MSLKHLFLSFCFLPIIVLTGCRSDEAKLGLEIIVDEPNVWTDSIFGQLTDRQQYYQHLIIEVPANYQAQSDSLVSWVKVNEPGGLSLLGWNPDSISILKNALDTLQILKPVFYSNFYSDLDLAPYPYWKSNKKNTNNRLMQVFKKGNFGLVDFTTKESNLKGHTWIDSIQSELGIQGIVASFDDDNLKEDLSDFLALLPRNSQAIKLEFGHLDSVNLNAYRKTSDFKGCFIVKAKVKKINSFLNGGADFVIKNIESADGFADWKGTNQTEFDNSTKRILDFKRHFQNSVETQNLKSELLYARLNFTHNSIALISNKSNLIPFDEKFKIYGTMNQSVSQKVRQENQVSYQKIEWEKTKISKVLSSEESKVILVPDTSSVEMLDLLASSHKKNNTLICFSNIAQYELLKNVPYLCFIPSTKTLDLSIFAQQLTSRIDLDGDFVIRNTVEKGIHIEKTKLGRTVPEFVGYDTDTLRSINWLVNNAMNGMAFPGCQVLLAKNGCIIYDNQYGHHSYNRQENVTDESMYDVASITKIFATTMVGMKLYEIGSYRLKDSLDAYLPDTLTEYLPYPSTIKNITFEELFIHKSGMPAGFPIIRYMQYTNENIGRLDKYYCDRKDSVFSIEVAENFYLDKEYADSMWIKLNQIWLDKSKPYKYSDVNMNTLYMMFKSIIQNKPKDYGFNESQEQLEGRDLFVEFLYKTYYQPLGMNRTLYKPLSKYALNQIVPTEDESYWRKQLLQGHVHDPNAALMGGVGGNAGIFSTTNDMAKLCQMLLNKGVYNGQRFLKEETVTKFTSAQEGSHRGLGFNKKTISTTGFGMATESSVATYGHTGFTGTCFWIDPEEELVYIFLSNRVHPKVNDRIYQYGIRKSIHNTAYDSRMFE
jgi:CubicO group peptidase (beta-lactamase class C family)